MRYEKPELKEIGEANEVIQTLMTGNPNDVEASTGWHGFIDQLFADE